MTHEYTKQELLKALYSQHSALSTLPIETSGATKIVYGEGDPNAPLMIVGEAPGQKEDELGRPFVGRSGMLLTQTLQKAGLARNAVFITNVVKCRPPNNRTPTPLEIAVFKKLFLLPEIKIIAPRLILAVGSIATKALFDDPNISIGKVRGRVTVKNGISILPTYHPAYILRNPAELKTFEKDIQLAISLIKDPNN